MMAVQLINGQATLIDYGIHETPFGHCLLGMAEDKLCYFSFFDSGQQSEALAALVVAWPTAVLREKPIETAKIVAINFSYKYHQEIKLLVQGTPFQLAIWRTVLTIPQGSTWSYEALANAVKKPTAIRAAANAVAKNTIALFIPCHRVIHKSGAVGNYRWGVERKQQLLAWESIGG